MKKLLIFIAIFAILIPFFLFYPIAKFPAASGPYGVGQKQFHWVDTARKELNAQDPQHPNREIMAYVFYPTEKNDAAKTTPYDQDAMESSIEYLSSVGKLPTWLFSGLKSFKIHAQPNETLAKTLQPFPVVIFSHGGGPMVQQYSCLLEELTSQGFMVVAINHPYIAAITRYPDGRVIKSMYRDKNLEFKALEKAGKITKEEALQMYITWKMQQLETNSQDIGFVITKIKELATHNDELWSHINVNKIGMLGHSFGGATTIRATRKDKRIKCGVNLEGGLHGEDIDNPFPTPFMIVLAEKSFLWNPNHPHFPKMDHDLDALPRLAHFPGTNMKIVKIKDAGHNIFSDVSFQLNMTLFTRILSRYCDFSLGVPAGHATEIFHKDVMPTIVAFFDEQLKK